MTFKEWRIKRIVFKIVRLQTKLDELKGEELFVMQPQDTMNWLTDNTYIDPGEAASIRCIYELLCEEADTYQ